MANSSNLVLYGQRNVALSRETHRAIDQVEQSSARVGDAIELVTGLLGDLEKASFLEQTSTLRTALAVIGTVGDAPAPVLTELERQLTNYVVSQGAVMDDVRRELAALVAEFISRPSRRGR
jgi:hypothetical protein